MRCFLTVDTCRVRTSAHYTNNGVLQMTGRKLAIGCLAALALALTGCDDPVEDKPDASTPDASGPMRPDAGQPWVEEPYDGGILGACGYACAEDEFCDDSFITPVCMKYCNPPVGCRGPVEGKPNDPYEICNQTERKCEPRSCGNDQQQAQCEFGQGCYRWDKDQGKFIQSVRCSCSQEFEGGEVIADTCWEYGMVCDFDPANPVTYAKCKKPSAEWENCKPEVGCDGNLECRTFPGAFYCLKPCETSADCADPMEYCLPDDPAYISGARKSCWYNFCAEPQGAKNPLKEMAKYFKPCNATGENDGTCFPLVQEDESGIYDIGICFQGGTAPSGGKCDPKATRANMAGICPVGELCDEIQAVADDGSELPFPPLAPDGGVYTGEPIDTAAEGICRPVCNSGPAPLASTEKPCAEGQSCLDVSGLLSYPTASVEARMGYCYQGCSVSGSAACPDDVLGNKQGCTNDFSYSDKGICYSLRPDAKKLGEKCLDKEYYVYEGRDECGDRLSCVGYEGASSLCQGFCDRSLCPDEGESCFGCQGATCCTPVCSDENGRRCEVADGCGGKCGGPGGEKCNKATKRCVACSPSCDGKTCGSDGCGGVGGALPNGAGPDGEFCTDGVCGCNPSCMGPRGAKQCGMNACGEQCGPGCLDDETCNPTTGMCEKCQPGCTNGKVCVEVETDGGAQYSCCTPNCEGKTCGDDGCGGTCGEYGGKCQYPGQACQADGTCSTECIPDCGQRDCGDDGCGGSCGTACADGQVCRKLQAGAKCTVLGEPESALGICK